jgi:hypothetical protein
MKKRHWNREKVGHEARSINRSRWWNLLRQIEVAVANLSLEKLVLKDIAEGNF